MTLLNTLRGRGETYCKCKSTDLSHKHTSQNKEAGVPGSPFLRVTGH